MINLLKDISNPKFIRGIYFACRHAVAQLVEALRYKPEGRGSIPDGLSGIFH